MVYPAEDVDFVCEPDEQFVHAAITELFPGRVVRDLALGELSRALLRANELKYEARHARLAHA